MRDFLEIYKEMHEDNLTWQDALQMKDHECEQLLKQLNAKKEQVENLINVNFDLCEKLREVMDDDYEYAEFAYDIGAINKTEYEELVGYDAAQEKWDEEYRELEADRKMEEERERMFEERNR